MVYSKEVTAQILADFARGASAEETHKHLLDLYGKAPCINTIYTHRKSITAEQIVDELIRQQQRDITKEDNSDRRMYYRDKLLEKLMQLKIEIVSKNLNINKSEVKHVIEFVEPTSATSDTSSDQVQASSGAKPIQVVNGEIQNPELR